MDNNLSYIKERILTYADYKGIAKSDFVEGIGMTYGNFKGSNKYRPLNSDAIENILTSCVDLNPMWLLTGQGSMLKTNTKDFPDIREDVRVVSESNNSYERKLIPFFDGIVEAGTQTVANMDGTYPTEMVDAGDFFQDATAVMAVHGDSMLPDYKPGSLVALKEVYDKRQVIPGQDYVIETSEFRVIKRIQSNLEDRTSWLACSTNEEVWEQGIMKGRQIHEPFPVFIDDVRKLYLVLGQIQRNHSSKIIYGKYEK
ncbi:hypothetical protein D0T84_16390 [Dysgonomonas sp. 521]|uniref:S24 family peptidase n=1 Tax=Dysgonomonas sp. 521 TaxID=2302932 RepID=UPI0013CF400E|nr:S24 family peptidase [Dysgonomonas sp. 521]NDV96481.1 hypothetical protein [Dysgonomonas sp. 521]